MLQDLQEEEKSCEYCIFNQLPKNWKKDDPYESVCEFNQMKISELMKKQKKCKKYIQTL